MTEPTPPLRDADLAKLSRMADSGSDRREREDASLRAARPRSEPGTVLASLQEIRQILRDHERSDGERAYPEGGPGTLIGSATAVDEPRREGTAALSARPLVPPAAPPRRRNGAARAVLAVAGLALLGALSLLAVRGRDLPDRAASAPGKGASHAHGHAATVARAALPARIAAVAGNAAARPPTAAPQRLAASPGAAAPGWINPLPELRTLAAAPVDPSVPPARAAARPSGGGLVRTPIAVTQWSFRSGNREIASASGNVPAGRPLTLRIVFDGNLAAAQQIRARGGIAVEVRWIREASGGAPNLVTRLTIGNRGLAGTLAAEARRAGFFVWHSWAEKRSLSRGTWTVSLTYPNGQPLACGRPPAPCRFHIAAG
ncbi:MAG TPA: hypothetical protein VE993_21080 [Stellaceae bacterium]|nr:hypothetical protein [Stellaceae bacterium]